MGLKLFQGKRGQANKKTTASAGAAPTSGSDYHPAPSAPPASSSTTIQNAVPVAYVPPATASPTASPVPQRQVVQAANTSSAPPPSSSGMYHNQNYNQNGGGGLMITNQELDHNIKLWQRATLGGRTLPHKLFIIFSIITILTAVNNIIAHTLAILFYGSKEDPMEQILRMFTIGWYVLVILIESNKSELVQRSLIFHHWAARGVLYIFLGVLGCVEYDVGQQNYGGSYQDRYNQYTYGRNNNIVIYIPSGEDAFELYIWCTSWIMLFVGLVYTMMGACCLHQKYQRLEAQYQQRNATGQQAYGNSGYSQQYP